MKISNNNNRSVGEKGEGDEMLKLPIGILQDDTGQVVGNERTHPITTLSHNNNTTTRLKRGPNPLSGVLIPRPPGDNHSKKGWLLVTVVTRLSAGEWGGGILPH